MKENKEIDFTNEIWALESENEWLKISKKIKLKNVQSVKNGIYERELQVDKDIRSCAIKFLIGSYKTAEENLKSGKIKFYKMKFKKKTDPKQNIALSSRLVDIKNGSVMINLGSCQGRPGFDSYKMSYKNKKKYKNLEISHDCIITLHKKKYVLQIPVEISKKPIIQENFSTYCGVDPGERTLLTAYGNKGVTEYNHNRTLLNSLYNKIAFLKSKNFKNLRKTKNLKTLNKKRKRYGVRKKQINKIEKKIESIINILHWSSINDLVKENDIIYFGDIKTHGIVKDGKNKNLNRNLNGLKLYKYKQRLIFKAIRAGKRVVLVNESYTTQGCSKCGTLWPKIGNSETYYCQNKDCSFVHGRDMNAAKNICMKGMLRA